MMNTYTGEVDLQMPMLPIQTPISFRNSLTDTSRNNVLPAMWVSLGPPSWHIKLTITPTLGCFWCFQSNEFVVVTHYGFKLNINVMNNDVEHIFTCLVVSFCCELVTMLPKLYWIVFLLLTGKNFLYITDLSLFLQRYNCLWRYIFNAFSVLDIFRFL